MEPIVKELEIKKILKNSIFVNGKEIAEINIKRLAIRPVLKKIIFVTKELDRIVIYEGEIDFNTHKEDLEELLINKLIEVINTKYSA